jgi:hypothetical protein
MEQTTPSHLYPGDVTIQAPFDEDVRDMTVVYKGKAVRIRFTERGWRDTRENNPSFLQDVIDKAFV